MAILAKITTTCVQSLPRSRAGDNTMFSPFVSWFKVGVAIVLATGTFLKLEMSGKGGRQGCSSSRGESGRMINPSAWTTLDCHCLHPSYWLPIDFYLSLLRIVFFILINWNQASQIRCSVDDRTRKQALQRFPWGGTHSCLSRAGDWSYKQQERDNINYRSQVASVTGSSFVLYKLCIQAAADQW